MNEPKRWLNDGAPEMIGRMLRAAGDERPSAGSLDHALAGLAAGAGILGAATGAAGASAGATLKGALLAKGVFLKWSLLGALATVGAGGLVLGFSTSHEARVASQASASSTYMGGPLPTVPVAKERSTERPAASAPPSDQDAREVSALAAPASKAERTTAGSEPRRPADIARAPAAPTIEGQQPHEVVDVEVLAQETRLVDRARAEHAAGRAAAALVTLDEYQTRFPRPRYAPEALYLRMEALLSLGNTRAARQVATRLASSHANSPHAARAEAVLSTTIP